MDGLGRAEQTAVERVNALLELLPPALDRHLAPTGLTLFEITLLGRLHASAQRRLRLTVLAARTSATLPRLSRVVTRLERRGLVVRRPCEEDARATNALLTDAGAAAYERAQLTYHAVVRDLILGGLSAQDVERLGMLAHTLVSRLEPQEPARAQGGAARQPWEPASGGAGPSSRTARGVTGPG